MKMSTSLVAGGLVPASALLVAPSAEAGTVWYGNNKGWTSSSNTRLWINDGEADGDTAYSKGRAGNGSSVRVNDLDGSSGSSWYITVNTAVERHATCETGTIAPIRAVAGTTTSDSQLGLHVSDALLRRPDGSDLLRVPKLETA